MKVGFQVKKFAMLAHFTSFLNVLFPAFYFWLRGFFDHIFHSVSICLVLYVVL